MEDEVRQLGFLFSYFFSTFLCHFWGKGGKPQLFLADTLGFGF